LATIDSGSGIRDYAIALPAAVLSPQIRDNRRHMFSSSSRPHAAGTRFSAARLWCALVLLAAGAQMLWTVRYKSITVDEIVMIPAAYYHVVAGRHFLVNEHPPLAKIAAGLPLLLVQPNEVRRDELKTDFDSADARWAHYERFWEGNFGLFPHLSFFPRVSMVALALLLAFLTFRFAESLFGPAVAAVAVTFFALEPTMLAHGRVVQTDAPAALGLVVTLLALRRYAGDSRALTAAAVGAAGGVAMLAKFSMLFVLPMCALFLLGRLLVHRGRGIAAATWHAAIAVAALILTVNLAYGFDHRPLHPTERPWITLAFPESHQWVRPLAEAFNYILPTDFVHGILLQIRHLHDGHAAGLLGDYRQHGWWYYFPVAFALKVPIPFLLWSLAATAAAAAAAAWRERPLLWVLLPLVTFAALLPFSSINIGVRYALPAFPLLFILCGWLAIRIWESPSRLRLLRPLVIAAAAWMAVEAVRVFPNHMSYMNQITAFGERPAWWYLSDSNVEWGDDQRDLARYLNDRGEHAVKGAFLGGFIVLHHYGVDYVDLLPGPAVYTKYVAIGASFLNGSTVPTMPRPDGSPTSEAERVNMFDAYRRRTPEAVIGGIYLFREDRP
jgi:hypothetical protein